MNATTEILATVLAATKAAYPSVKLPAVDPVSPGWGVVDRAAEIKADLIAGTPYKFYGGLRDHIADVLERLTIASRVEVFSSYIVDSLKPPADRVLDNEQLGWLFRRLVEKCIMDQAWQDVEESDEDEAAADLSALPLSWRE